MFAALCGETLLRSADLGRIHGLVRINPPRSVPLSRVAKNTSQLSGLRSLLPRVKF